MKVSFNVPNATVETLRGLAKQRSTTLTEVLRSAIRTEAYLSRVMAEGGRVLIQPAGGETQQLVFMTQQQ